MIYLIRVELHYRGCIINKLNEVKESIPEHQINSHVQKEGEGEERVFLLVLLRQLLYLNLLLFLCSWLRI